MGSLTRRYLTKLLMRGRVLLSVREASERYKIPIQTIYSWIYMHKAKSARRIEGHWRIAEDEVTFHLMLPRHKYTGE